MKYNVEFLKSLSETTDIFLILERGFNRGGGSAAAQDLKSYLSNIQQKTGAKYIHYTGTSFLTRIPKLKLFLLTAWVKGFRNVYVHYSFVGAFYASLFPGFKVFYWNCGIPWQYKRPFLQELYESTTYKLIDHFVTGAEVLTNKYSEFYNFPNSKSIVIPNWIDVEKFTNIIENTDKEKLRQELNISSNQIVIFFNQRLAERKGAHYIPSILTSTTPGGRDDIVLVITNDGPYKEKLIEQLKQENLFDYVRLLGKVPNQKVAEILSITDIYILPSEEEGMSHSLMEAMCAKVSAVSFDVGGTIDMYPEAVKSFVVPEKDINSFNEKVKVLLESIEKRKMLGNALFEQVKKYDKKIILEKFYLSILSW
jgi:glycosyltransferase involved in cell wall biosynthesis